jgi:hypothetical protein
MGLVHGLAQDLRRPQKYLVQASHAFWLSSDDRSACSHGPGGHLCALSIGDVRFVRPAQVAVSELRLAAMTPLWRRGHPARFQIWSQICRPTHFTLAARNKATGGNVRLFLNRSIIMRIDHPPHHKRARRTEPSFWVDQPADDALSLFENALRGAELPLCGNEQTDGLCNGISDRSKGTLKAGGGKAG